MPRIINRKTGEVLADSDTYRDIVYEEDRIQGVPSSEIKLRIPYHNGRIEFGSIGCYIENQKKKPSGETQPDETDETSNPGESSTSCVELLDIQFLKKKFSKVFHNALPVFTSYRYYAFWVKIERSLEQDTGMIVSAKGKKKKLQRIETLNDWAKFLDCPKSVTCKFLQEAVEKTYLAKFITGDFHFWIINPTYCWNGNTIPLNIWMQFNPF